MQYGIEFFLNLLEICSTHTSTSFGTFCVEISQLLEAQ